MKICPKCKQQYADNVAVCRADGTFLDLDTPVSEAETQPNVLNKDTAATDAPHVAESVDRIGTAAAETFDRAPGDFGVGGGVATAGSGSVADAATSTDFSRIDDSTSAGGDYAENPMSGWLVPLIIVVVLIILGFMFCSKRAAAASAAAETNEIQMNGATNKLI